MADDYAILGLGVESGSAVSSIRTFTHEMVGMTGAVKQATVALTSLFAGAKVTQFIFKTANAFSQFGDDMAKMSQRLGVSAQSLSELYYIVGQAGTSMEQLENGMRFLQRNLYNADEEAKSATEAFKKLGLSVSALKMMKPDEQFKAVAAAIAELPSPTERSALAMKIFSRGGTQLLPLLKLSKEEMGQLADRAAKLGLVMGDDDYSAAEELNDAIDTLNASFQGLKNSIAQCIGPALSDMMNRFADVIGKVSEFAREHEKLVKTILGIGIAATAVGSLVGAYFVLKTAMQASALISARLAAARAANTGAINAETAALNANTAAQAANNATKGGGTAADLIKDKAEELIPENAKNLFKGKGGKLVGGYGTMQTAEGVAMQSVGGHVGAGATVAKGIGAMGWAAIAAVGAAAVNNFIEGLRDASQKGETKIDSVGYGIINAVTLGIGPATKKITKTLKEYKAGAQDAADATISVTRSLTDVATLGISKLTAKLFEGSGAAEAFGKKIVAIDWKKTLDSLGRYGIAGTIKAAKNGELYTNLGARQAELDKQLANAKVEQDAFYALRDAAEALKDSSKRIDLTTTASFRRAQAQTWRGVYESRLDGSALSAAKVDDAMNAYNESYAKYEAERESLKQGGQDKVDAARRELKDAQAELVSLRKRKEEYRDSEGKLTQEYLDREKAYTERIKTLTAKLVDTENAAQSADDTAAREAFANAGQSLSELEAARVQLYKDIQDESEKQRQDELAMRDTELSRQFIGMGSDEARAAQAGKEAGELETRLQQMKTAQDKINSLEAEIRQLPAFSQRADELERQIAYQKGIAGTVQDRLALEVQIEQKISEQNSALRSITEREAELSKTRAQREKEFKERSEQMAEDYAAKWMSEQEIVAKNQQKLSALQEQAAGFGEREEEIKKLDEEVKRLSDLIAAGGEQGLKAEEDMNRVMQTRARLEEELAQDRSKNLTDYYSALNEIENVANMKAEEYQEQLQKLAEADRNDRKPVSVIKAVDAASAEGFAQMNKIYDTSQRRVEDNTKSIKEYTRQMKQYLMELATQGRTDWALDVQGG